MPNTPEKKFFLKSGKRFALVKGRRWYVEHYEEAGSSGVMVRRREYGQINRIKDLKARELAALALIETLAVGGMPKKSRAESSFLLQILSDHQHLFRKKSLSCYRSHIKAWEAWLNGAPAQKATGEAARAFCADLAAGKAKATVRNYVRTLHGLYEKAGMEGALNPFYKVKTAAPDSKGLKPFSEAQAAAILGAVRDPALRVAILLVYYCFIRPGSELPAVDIQDVDLERGFIELRGEISKNKKTQKVAIPNALLPELGAFIGARHSGPLLLNAKGERPGKDYFCRAHRKILESLGIRGRYALYSWKHTGVVRLVQAGVNIRDIQNQLRHHSLEMVERYLKGLGVMDSQELRSLFPAPTRPAR